MNKKGFTLIELLVVVLIIGILASVALPQYKKAVIKSRFAIARPIMKSIEQAQEAYYLANGVYADIGNNSSLLEVLDISIPLTTTADRPMWILNKDMLLVTNSVYTYLKYCPNRATSFSSCGAGEVLFMKIRHSHVTSGGWETSRCVFRDPSLKSICAEIFPNCSGSVCTE